MNIFGDILKVFRNFIFRDIMYLTSGTLIFSSLSIIWFSDKIKYITIPDYIPPYIVFILGMSIILLTYAFGYGLQELFSVLRIISTGYNKPKRKLMIWILTQFSAGGQSQWTKMSERKDVSVLKIWKERDNICNENKKSRINRTVNLMQIGTALTPGLFISFLIILFKLFFGFSTLYLFFLILIFVFFLIMWLVSKIKNYQLSLMFNEIIK